MNPFTLFTLSGPLMGVLGWYLNVQWVLWIGVVLCAINLFMNMASGAMKLPVLPVLATIVGAGLADSLLEGAGYGLLTYTAFEGIAELWPSRRPTD